MRLNQLLAIEKGLKGTAETVLTQVYHKLQKPTLLAGLAKQYEARNEEEMELPPPDEEQAVQLRVRETFAEVTAALGPLWNATLAKELANTLAAADIVVDGKVLLSGAPVTFLLFVEKQLVNLATFLEKLPTLDPAQTWEWDPATACYRTPAKTTLRTKKILRVLVKFEPTDRQPGQADSYAEDVPVGTWQTTQFSGAIPESERRALVARCAALTRAVKTAREQANMSEVKESDAAKAVFDYLFAA